MLTLKPSDVRSTYKSQVNFDIHTKTKSISIPYTKYKLVSTLSLKWSQFPSSLNIKSITMPRYKNRVNFDTYTKYKSCTTATQKRTQFRR